MSTIESLELEIKSNSESAASGIDKLTKSLEKLKGVTGGKMGLSAVAKEINEFNKANVDGVKTKMATLSTAISTLSNLPKSNLSGFINPLKKLPEALAGLTNTNMSSLNAGVQGLVSALAPLSQLPKSNLSGYITSLKKIPEVLEDLNKVDMDAFATKMDAVATAMRPLATEMEKISKGFSAMPSKIQKLITETNKIPSSNKKASQSFTDLYHKVKAIGNAFIRAGKSIMSVVTKSMDYTENMNLFSVSMGQYARDIVENGELIQEGALTTAERFSEALGIDTSDWIRAQGVFMTMATGFGVAGDRAAKMSKNLTQLGYDLASFYNMDVDDAMTKLKSGLAGELEPLRAIGYDLSQAKLEATATALGITKSVSAMTQAEKAQLRYYAIMTQVTQAQGDMARTLEDPANQVRVFKAQMSMAAREIGNVFIPALNAILPYCIALVKIIGSLANSIAGLFGYKDKGLTDTTSKVVENTDALTDGLRDSQEQAKKLKSYMLGFDELNVINPNEGEDDDTSGWVDFELPEYDFLKGLAESKVNTIVEEMKEWLGITEDIDSWADLLDTKLGDILETVGLIGVGLLGWKVSKSVLDAFELIKVVSGSPSYVVTISAILAIVGITLAFKGMKEAVEKGLDGFNFAEIIGGSLLGTGGAALLGTKIATWITTAFASSGVAKALTSGMAKLGYASVGAFGGAITGGIVGIVAGIGMMFVGIRDAIKEGIDWLSGILTAGGAVLAGAGIGAFFGPVGIAIGALIGLAVGLITDLVILIVQKWDEIYAWLDTNIIQPMKTFFKPLLDACAVAWAWLVENLFTPFAEAFNEVKDYAIEKFTEIKDGVVTAFTVIRDKVVEIKNKIVEIFTALKWAFDEYVWNPIKKKVSEFYNEHIKPIVDVIQAVAPVIWEAFKVKVFDKVKNKINELLEDFKKFGKGVVDFISGMFKTVINCVLTAIENKINNFIKLLNGAISLINMIPGVNIAEISLISIPRLAEGAFDIPAGQMFVAREAGAEMVGTIGRKTAVANNDQIVSGIAGGVAEANAEQNALLREQNSLLQALLEKDNSTYLDGRRLTDSVEKYQRERGRVLVKGGVM